MPIVLINRNFFTLKYVLNLEVANSFSQSDCSLDVIIGVLTVKSINFSPYGLCF